MFIIFVNAFLKFCFMTKSFILILKSIFLILFGIFFIIGFSGCQKKNIINNGQTTLNYNLLKTKITIRFINAKTHEIIGKTGGKRVSVTVAGTDKDALVDISGLKHNSYKSINGIMVFALIPNELYLPSKQNPIYVSFKAKLNGYVNTEKSLILTHQGNYQLQIAMAEMDNLPDGVEKEWKTGLGNISDSILQNDIVVVTPNLNISLTIPQGTILLDKDSTLLNSPLTISIIYFSNKNNDALSIFPGGVISSILQNKIISNGMFFSAGFAIIDIYGANGKKAAIFANKKPVVTMLLDADTYNPETQTKISAGDLVDLDSFLPDSGIWVYEHTDTIVNYTSTPPIADFAINTKITHLSSYIGFNWFWNDYCYNSGQAVFSFDTNTVCNNGFISGIVKRQSDSAFVSWIGSPVSYGDTLCFPVAPSSIPLFINWQQNSCQNIIVAPESNPLFIDNSCDNTIYNVSLLSLNNTVSSVLVDMSASCPSSPDVIIRPEFGVWYRPKNTFCWKWADMNNGYSKLCNITLGEDYIIGTYYDNQWKQWDFTADESWYLKLDFELPNDICNGVFGL